MQVSHGYADKVLDQKALRHHAQIVANALPKVMHMWDADTVVVTGKSGISMGFAVGMLIDFPLVVVRKPGENSHGITFEGPRGHHVGRYIILDDFVASGETVRRVQQQIMYNDEQCKLVGVLTYDGDSGGSNIDVPLVCAGDV